MALQENCFTSFKEPIDSCSLPERFTFPFYYQPHPLCLVAAKELQDHLQSQSDWQHNFGLSDSQDMAIGKMFGVLLVKNQQNEVGYLSAFSGKLADSNHLPKFVPPVFDMLDKNGFFILGQLEVNQISDQINTLEKNPQLLGFENSLQTEIDSSTLQIKTYREKIIENRKIRKSRRIAAENTINKESFLLLKDQLSKESISEKNQLRDLNIYWNEKVQNAQLQLNQLTDKISVLKNHRKDLSSSLQQTLFDQYRFLNIKGVEKSLSDIFKQTPQKTPPAGAGECAAPKLLQYAFNLGLKPLAMAEFWWGESPKSAIRKHQNFYTACQGKCQPILDHMLEGMELDENPLLVNMAKGKPIEIIYEDDVMLVINKPAELLSIPGKSIEDSVYQRMKLKYPSATGPLTVHRLDMSTSGLMLIALSLDSHKKLQRQFIKRSIKKRYIALLDGLITEDEGFIELPLRVDLDDRPRQLVCYEHGKQAKTQWKVLERKNNKTKVFFFPITGRTHQLRVHSAHLKGLNTPIVGDDLYGNKANRLHLHAEFIEFSHPTTRELMNFQVDAAF